MTLDSGLEREVGRLPGDSGRKAVSRLTNGILESSNVPGPRPVWGTLLCPPSLATATHLSPGGGHVLLRAERQWVPAQEPQRSGRKCGKLEHLPVSNCNTDRRRRGACHRLLEGCPVHSKPQGPGAVAWRWGHRRPPGHDPSLGENVGCSES